VRSRIDEMHESSSSTLTDLPKLLNRFVEQVLQLLETQFALFKAEVRDGVRSYGKNLTRTAVAGIVAVMGFALLNVGVALWLNALLQNLALSFALVGGAYFVLGSAVALVAVRKLSGQPAVLAESKRELERDKQWIKSGT